jgi:hypothetical protein
MTSRKLLICAMVVFLVIIVGCSKDRGGLEGKYQAGNNNKPGSPVIFLELGANGKGSWATEEDNVSFKWEIRKKEVWLHTNLGGVIVGKITRDTIEIGLPGAGIHVFKKISIP